MAPRGKPNPLEPSHFIILENPLHKFPRKARQVVKLNIYGRINTDANLSKSFISVNRKME
jgi:hypothetical protein